MAYDTRKSFQNLSQIAVIYTVSLRFMLKNYPKFYVSIQFFNIHANFFYIIF